MPIFKGCNYKKSHFPILFPVCFLCSPEVWISLISFGIFLHLLELIHGGLDRCVGNACTHFKCDVLLEDDPLEEYIDRCCHRQSHLIQKDFRLALYLFINRYHIITQMQVCKIGVWVVSCLRTAQQIINSHFVKLCQLNKGVMADVLEIIPLITP